VQYRIGYIYQLENFIQHRLSKYQQNVVSVQHYSEMLPKHDCSGLVFSAGQLSSLKRDQYHKPITVASWFALIIILKSQFSNWGSYLSSSRASTWIGGAAMHT